MADLEVRTGELRATADVLAQAVRAARSVVEHPGVVRGRAQDGGCLDLREAAVEFAARWQHALGLMVTDISRTADALRLAADTYDQAESVTLAALGPGGRR
ncbi:MAG TPA: type VII secretion target [Actinomycetales bacterium]|jgi:hypothetical protein